MKETVNRIKEMWREYQRKRWRSKTWIRFCFMLDKLESLYREFIRDPVWRFCYERKLEYWELQRRAIKFWEERGVIEVVRKDEDGRPMRYEEHNYM